MRKKYLSALLFGALLVTSAGTFTSCKDYDDEINNLQEQITANADAIKALQDKIGDGKFVTNIASESNGLKITWNDGSSTVIENVINGEDQKGDVVSIDPETGEIKINNEGTGFYASKGEGETPEEAKLPYVNEEGVLVIFDENGEEVVTGIRVSPVTAVINEDGSAVLTIIAADGTKQTINIPSAASMMQDLEIMGWIDEVSDASENLSINDIEKDDNIIISYRHISKIVKAYDNNDETTWSAQKEVVKGQVLTTISLSNTKLVTRVAPANLDLSQFNFSLQDSKGNKLPVSLKAAEEFTGALTRTNHSGIYYIALDDTDAIYNNADEYTKQITKDVLYSLVEEKSGARSTYGVSFETNEYVFESETVYKVDGKTKVGANFEVDINKANKLEFANSQGICKHGVYDYYVEPVDKAVADLFGLTIDKKNGTFTVSKLADQITTTTFDLYVYRLLLDGRIYRETITIKPSRKMIGEAVIAAGDQVIKQVVGNDGKVDANYANDMTFTVSLNDMFSSLSDADKAKWASATLGAISYEISSVKVGSEDKTTTDKGYFALEALKADGKNANNWYEAKNAKVVVTYKDASSATLDIDKQYTVTVNFKDKNGEVLNSVDLTFTPKLPELSSYMVKHPSFWEGNKLMGISQSENISHDATETTYLTYDIKDGFKSIGSDKDADKLALTFELSDNTVDDVAFVTLNQTYPTIVGYYGAKGANPNYGKEFTVKVKEATYLDVYKYGETDKSAQSFKMVVLDPVYEGSIKPAEGSSLEVIATGSVKLNMSEIVATNYNGLLYNLYKDVVTKGDELVPVDKNNKEADDFKYSPIKSVKVESLDKQVFTVAGTGEPTVATYNTVTNKVDLGYVTLNTKELSQDTQTKIRVIVEDFWGYKKTVDLDLLIKMNK